MKTPLLYLFMILSFCVSSCKQSTSQDLKPTKSRSILPPNTGNISEIVIVIPDDLWSGDVGQALKEIFQANVLGIPQQEAMFDVFAINPNQFSSIFKSHKNILWLSIADTTEINKQMDNWSKDQLFVSIASKTKEELALVVREHGLNIRAWFLAKDLVRRTQKIKQNSEIKLQQELFNTYNYNIVVPSGFSVTLSEQDFIWLRRDQPKLNVISNVWLHTMPYTNENQLSKEYLIQLRDSLGKTHVEGARPHSYMTTEMLYEPDFTITSENPYTIEIRGLWTMVNDFLGGSFISSAQLDKKNNRIIYAEGFLYCPNERKRYHLQELESILYSLKFE